MRSYGDAVILGISAFVVIGDVHAIVHPRPGLVYNELVVVRNRVSAQQKHRVDLRVSHQLGALCVELEESVKHDTVERAVVARLREAYADVYN